MKKQDILAAIAAGAVFLVFLLGGKWNFLISAILSVGIYFALSLLLKPRRTIGGVDVETMQNGQQLEKAFDDAREDLKTIRECGMRSPSKPIQQGSVNLAQTGSDIISYLEVHVDKVSQARRFLNYYLDAGAEILSKYTKLRESNPPHDEMQRVERETESAVRTLDEAFSRQYSKLLNGEVMDISTDIKVLRDMADTDK